MKIAKLLAVFLLIFRFANAQYVYDGYGKQIAMISGDYLYDGSGKQIGRISGNYL